MDLRKTFYIFGIALVLLCGLCSPSYAEPRPVRIAIVAATGSGTEQQVVDNLSSQLQEDENIVLSTVNPDWYVTCHIEDHTDVVSLTVRINGTVTIKAVTDGNVLNTVSAQANKQDFSVTGPGPINKALVTSATNEVIQELTQRAVQPIEDAAVTEIATREKLLNVHALADSDKYDDALAVLMTITRDSPHFWPAHTLEADLQMEKAAYDLVMQARAQAKRGDYREATIALRQVNPKSKRYKLAQAMIASFPRPTLAKNKTKPASTAQSNSNAQLKALEAQKQALDAQRQAIDAQESALRSKDKP